MSLKASFMFVNIFVDVHENSRRKSFINPSCPKRPKIIEIKNDKKLFHSFFWCPIKVLWRPEDLHKTFLRHQERSEKMKILSYFPPYSGLRWQWLLRLCFVEIPTYTISISLTIETHKNKTWSIKTKLVC